MTEKLYHIPTMPGMGRSLVHHDEKSKMFRAVSLLGPSQQEPRDRHWRRGGPYDQGETSECVANTGKGMLNTYPLSTKAPYKVRSKYSTHDFYLGAQENDEWPGEAYDGTSGLGLCRWLKAQGLIEEYRWCFGLDDVLRTLSWVGPVGIGVWWWSGMFRPDSRGLIFPTGSKEGGHEIELTGVDTRNREVEFFNSWGKNWGVNGRGRMKWDVLGELLADDGDAFVITK